MFILSENNCNFQDKYFFFDNDKNAKLKKAFLILMPFLKNKV